MGNKLAAPNSSEVADFGLGVEWDRHSAATGEFMQNEKTSKRVAAIAGRILKRLREIAYADIEHAYVGPLSIHNKVMPVCTMAELKALAASCLTQSPNKPRLLTKRGGKK